MFLGLFLQLVLDVVVIKYRPGNIVAEFSRDRLPSGGLRTGFGQLHTAIN